MSSSWCMGRFSTAVLLPPHWNYWSDDLFDIRHSNVFLILSLFSSLPYLFSSVCLCMIIFLLTEERERVCVSHILLINCHHSPSHIPLSVSEEKETVCVIQNHIRSISLSLKVYQPLCMHVCVSACQWATKKKQKTSRPPHRNLFNYPVGQKHW